MTEIFTIGQLAHRAGVNVETIRFYQRKGLLEEPPRPAGGGYRSYGSDDAARLHFIKAAQRMGFTLDQIGQLLQLEKGLGCSEARGIAERRLSDVHARLLELQRMEALLMGVVADCGRIKGRIACPLITRLQT
ncbi:MAG: MerR family transcriptional regulator [Burkholderiaceae bacterium]